MTRNKNQLSGAKLLAAIELQANLEQISMHHLHSVVFTENGLRNKLNTREKLDRNCQNLCNWAKATRPGPEATEMAGKIFRQSRLQSAMVSSQIEAIQEYLTLSSFIQEISNG